MTISGYILTGLIMGFFTGLLTLDKSFGMIGHLFVGVIGATIGGICFEFLGLRLQSIYPVALTSAVGAFFANFLVHYFYVKNWQKKHLKKKRTELRYRLKH